MYNEDQTASAESNITRLSGNILKKLEHLQNVLKPILMHNTPMGINDTSLKPVPSSMVVALLEDIDLKIAQILDRVHL